MARDGRSTRRWLWSNVPVPEPHLAALAVALVGEAVTRCIARRHAPARSSRHARRLTVARLLGVTLLSAGAALGAASVRTAGEVDVARPGRLLTGGVYARTRNPMYLAWHLGYLGLALLTGSRWMLLAAAPMLYGTHRVIRREEEWLRARFGPDFDRYAEGVPRYASASPSAPSSSRAVDASAPPSSSASS